MSPVFDGAERCEDIIEKCKKLDMPAVAITNHGNMFRMLEHIQTGIKSGVKVIPGIELYMTWDFPCTSKGTEFDQRHHIILLAQNTEGYKNLLKLSTLAYMEGFYHKPRVDPHMLRRLSNGLIVLSACIEGPICNSIISNDIAKACKQIEYFKEVFGDRFYLEVQWQPDVEHQERCNTNIYDLAKQYDVKVVGTCDCHYAEKEHYDAWKTMMSIATNGKMAYALANNYWFKSYDELKDKLPDEVLFESGRIADRCEVIQFEKGYKFPHINLGGKSADQYLKELTFSGLERLYAEDKISKARLKEYQERAEYELGVLARMGFSPYIIIVSDYIGWCKGSGIGVGPGRGSAGGSLVCYLTQITSVDPVKYNLIFERFINPERISLPDCDTDIQDDKRDLLKEYLIDKYGQDHVAAIGTFGTMAARGVLRDVARSQGLDYHSSDQLAKAVPEMERGKNVYLSKAMENKDFKRLITSKPEYMKIYDIAKILEGMIRNVGSHASGIVISDKKPLVEYVPLYTDEDKQVVTQYDMHQIEAIGLIKFDVLGLATITTIKKAIEFIRINTGKEIDIDNIDLEDAEVYRLFGSGDLAGIFQFGGSGIFKDVTMRVQPTNIGELSDITSMCRPGPLDNGFHNIYIKNKNTGEYGSQVKVTHPVLGDKLNEIMKPTYGVCVYQEQVMEIAKVLAGYSLGQADLLRRAMGKKKPEEMELQKKGFVEGCVKNGIIDKEANDIFDMLAKFAEYGFNRSHSIAYSLISYQTAWLKTHYPTEFYAAAISEVMGKKDDVLGLVAAATDTGVKVSPPDINISNFEFTPVKDKKEVRFGLGGLKGMGHSAVGEVLRARNKNGKFHNLFDLCNRVDLRKANKKALEILIKSGTLDSIL